MEMKGRNILLIEDSLEARVVMQRSLQEFNVFQAGTIAEGEALLKSHSKMDVIILDIDLPDGDGLRFFSLLQADPVWRSIPTLIVSSHSSLPNKITAFSLGAEDFISKPFNPDELRARVCARIRKSEMSVRSMESVRASDLEIDLSSQRAHVLENGNKRVLDLTSKEFRILAFMMKRFESVCSRESLLEEVWGPGVNVVDRTVDTHVSHLRKKIQGAHLTIESVPGTGYRLAKSSSRGLEAAS